MKIFITGGTAGIGLALACLYLEEGHEVGICGRDLSKLPENFLSDYPRAKAYETSVTDLEKLKKDIDEFGEKGLDLVIANAGRSHGKKTKLPDFSVSRDIFQTNVIGVLNTFDASLEKMINQGDGHLVAIASVAGFVGLPGAGAYSASKSAVLKLCESYNLDLKKYGVLVTAIAPGFIDTPLTRQNDHSMPFILTAEQGAKRIKNAIDSKLALYVFPKRMKFIITILNKMPRSWYRSLMKLPFLNYSHDEDVNDEKDEGEN